MKKKVALHIIMPNQVSGPNTSNKRIAESWLNESYDFQFVTQNYHAGSRINFSLINDLKKQFEEINPDIIHLSGLQSSGFHAVVAAKLAGFDKIIFTIRGFSGDVIKLSRFKRFIFNSFIEPLSLKLCLKFYTVCENASKKKIVKRYKEKYVGVIYNAAPKINFDSNESRKKIRKDLKVDNETFLVVVSGRMVYDKGISFILEAIKNNKKPKIKFVFIGAGPYYDIIENQYKELISNKKIYLLGNRDDVLEILTGCDLFLFATLHENLSNALLEAMAVGLPIIATNVGGNIEVVENEGNGYLINSKNSEQINECIEKISEDKVLHREFSAKSIKIIREKFTQEELYKNINNLYTQILDA